MGILLQGLRPDAVPDVKRRTLGFVPPRLGHLLSNSLLTTFFSASLSLSIDNKMVLRLLATPDAAKKVSVRNIFH